jgi:pyruvate dehydrogenase kinase 2/3/4
MAVFSPAQLKDLDVWAKKMIVPVSLKSLLETGRGQTITAFQKMIKLDIACDKDDLIKIQVACFLHHQLPIRLAHRAKELESLPVLRECPHIALVCSWYKQSFIELRECPYPSDSEKEANFRRVVDLIFERHSHTLITMAKGAYELRALLKKNRDEFADYGEIQSILDNFYRSRIGIRILIGQYLALVNPPESKDMIGLISLNASVHDIALDAINDATIMCTRTHGDAPEVTIHGRTDLTFPYFPTHIHYILLELLKNSMRATVDFHGTDNMPTIKLIIADGETNEDVVMKVSDEGGGIKRSNMKRIWSYMFTTANPEILEEMLNTSESIADFTVSSPLAGLGYGLPISRLYARCFGGDLSVMSMEGYGTDCFIHLPRLNDISEEKSNGGDWAA